MVQTSTTLMAASLPDKFFTYQGNALISNASMEGKVDYRFYAVHALLRKHKNSLFRLITLSQFMKLVFYKVIVFLRAAQKLKECQEDENVSPL